MDARASGRWLSVPLVFFVLGAVFGTAFVVLTPPLRWQDENTHFVEAYRLSELNLVLTAEQGTMWSLLPSGVGKLLVVRAFERRRDRRAQREPLDRMLSKLDIEALPDERRPVALRNASYPPLGYLPQALGIALTRPFTRSVLLQLYGARLANLAAWLLLVWAALRATPCFRLAFAVLALSPLALFVAATCAVDAVTNGLAFLWTATVARLAFADAPPTRATLVRVGAIAVALALVKLAYAPLVLLLFAVPAERLGGPRRRAWIAGALLLASALAVVVWLVVARWQIVQGAAHRGPAAFADNAAAIVRDPLGVLSLLARSVVFTFRSALPLLVETIWHARPAWQGLSVLLLAAWLCALLAEPRRRWPTPLDRAVAFGVAVATVAGVVLVAFLLWTPGGAPEVSGLQARYVVPLLPVLTLAFCPPARVAAPPRARPLLGALALALTTTILLRTVQRGIRLWD